MRFSIVMPAYNPPIERFIAAVNSVQAQEHDDWELIVVDDGSRDPAVLEILEQLPTIDSRIRITCQTNSGVSRARNFGTRMATGSYVMYLDSDDELTPHALADADRILSTNDLDVLLAYVQDVREDVDKADLRTEDFKVLSANDRSVLLSATLAGGSNIITPSIGPFRVKIGPVARMIQRDLAQATPFPEDIEISEDTLWSLRILDQAASVAVLRSQWYWYWVAHESASRRYRPGAFEETRMFLAEMDRTIKQADIYIRRRHISSRVLGEVNRASSLFYARQECPLPWRQRRDQVRLLLSQPSTRVGPSEALQAGPKNLAKYLLLWTGAILSPRFHHW